MSDPLTMEKLDDPESLEQSYRTNRKAFLEWFETAAQDTPNLDIVRYWKIRLKYDLSPTKRASGRSILLVIILSLIASTLVKLHAFPVIDDDWYLPRVVPLVIFLSLIVYFIKTSGFYPDRKVIAIFLGGGLLSLLLPDSDGSASVTMALIHLPLVYLSGFALVFMKGDWKSLESRIEFLQYLGEVKIYSGVILLGGIVLTSITLALFSVIDVQIVEWYLAYIVVAGLVSSPIVATFLYDTVLGRNSRISNVTASIFAPLFFITVAGYFAVVLIQGKSPFSDREFLITFNGLLLLVLAITFFSISWRGNDEKIGIGHYINFGLLVLTLLINSYALVAIVSRLYEHGLTPNRFVVTGANLLIFIHLSIVLSTYYQVLNSKVTIQSVSNAVARYLPVYTLWSIFVCCGVPVIFWFV